MDPEKKEGTEEEVVEDRASELDEIAENVDRGDADEELEDELEDEIEDESDEESTDEGDSEEEELIEVVVDGEPQQVPLSKILDAGQRTYQKEATADARLKEIAEREKELEQRESQLSDEDVDEDPTDLEAAEERFNTAKKAYAKAITGVDEEAIEKAYDEVYNAQNEVTRLKAPDGEKIVADAVARVKMESIFERLQGPVEEGGQADIFADPRAKAIADMEAQKLIKEGASPLAWSTYEKAGEATREFLGWNKEEDDFEEKREKKEKIIDIKTAQKKSRSTVKKQKAVTHDEVVQDGIAALAKDRGQEL